VRIVTIARPPARRDGREKQSGPKASRTLPEAEIDGKKLFEADY
jgi:hypothetical protein